jgi:hypothetical protein
MIFLVLFFIVVVLLNIIKYHAAASFLIGGRESFEKGPWFLANVAVNAACQDLATLSDSDLTKDKISGQLAQRDKTAEGRQRECFSRPSQLMMLTLQLLS